MKNQFKITQNHFSIKKWVPHIVFWTAIWIIFALLEYNGDNITRLLFQEFISVLFYVILIYSNLYILIPKFLSDKSFLIYVVWLTTLVLLVTFAKVTILYLFFKGNESAQINLLINQGWLFLFNFIVAGGSTVFKIINDWIVHQRERKELERQNMQSELNFLRSQVNPHFLFNTLNNLYALTLKKSDKAPETVLKLSEIMRYMLYESNEKRVPLSKELAYMKNYLELESLRHGEQTDIKLTIKGDTDGIQIAPLLLIPFIENAFKHGVQNDLNDGYVHIDLAVKKDKLKFNITNSKTVNSRKELNGARSNKSGGIGLVNVQRRLNLIYQDDYNLSINNKKDSFNVKLDISLNKKPTI